MKKIYETPTCMIKMFFEDIVTSSKPSDGAIVTEKDDWSNSFQGG